MYLSCFRKLLPIFDGIHLYYCNTFCDLNDLELEWLGMNCKYLLLLLDAEDSNSMESCLLMTSLLDNALANVYFTVSNKRTPPHLLRDLLRTEEICSVFGTETISILKIIVGTPDSINLRNIVWHGFPKPQEIPDYYISILLLLMHTLGTDLKKKKMTPLIERPKIKDFSPLCEKVYNQLKIPSNWFDEYKYGVKIKRHSWLINDFKIYWYQIFLHYKTLQYWKVVLLIIPQIELLLRLIYARVNKFDVTAKLNEYYITMDSLFEYDVPNVARKCRNNLLDIRIVNGELQKCVYDLFIAPNGPRLRDKVSHGEAELEAIDNILLCDILMFLSMGLLDYESPFYNYESVFHLNCLTKDALLIGKKQLQKLMEMHVVETPGDSLKLLSDLKSLSKIKIFNRHKKDSEFSLLLLKNSNLVYTTCLNYEHSINTRLELLTQRELHSRRRRTLEKMLKSLPLVCTVLCEILFCLWQIFAQLQFDDAIYENETYLTKLLRFLKHTLKLNENFVKYSDINSNEWIKTEQLCRKFKDVKLLYYPL
ncbi:endoplasmic reticulum membrane-associated RNA degradation protein-like isoform X2 [Eurosta solidaginis]